MRYRLLFLFALLVASFQGHAAVVEPTDYNFVNNRAEEFTASVGQIVTRTGIIRFADAEIPPDPDQPVVRSGGGNVNASGLVNTNCYSFEITGADSDQFSARMVSTSDVKNECTMVINYAPRSIGSHTATLKAYCSKAGVPLFTIPLRGEATSVLGDLNGDGKVSVSDVISMINLLLTLEEGPSISDVNCDGVFNIADVSLIIGRVLESK